MVDWRILSSASFLLLAPLPLFARYGLSAVLWTVPFVILGMAILILSILWRKRPRTALVIGIFGVLVIVASYIARAPLMGVYGYDSNITLSILKRLSENSRLMEPISHSLRGSDKLQSYPIMYILSHSMKTTTGLSSLIIVKYSPAIILSTLPLFGYAVTPSSRHGKVAGASLWIVPTLYLSTSGGYVPQQFSLVLFGVLISLIVRVYINNGEVFPFREGVMITIIGIAMVLSHSLTPFITGILIIPLLILSYISESRGLFIFSLIYTTIIATVWVYNEIQIILVGIIAALIQLFGSESGAAVSVGPKPGQISIYPLPITRYPVEWFAIFGRLPLFMMLAASATVIFKRYVVNKVRDIGVLTIFLFFAGAMGALSVTFGPASIKRGWIFASLLSAPLVGYLTSDKKVGLPSITRVIRYAVLVAIITSVVLIPSNTFSEEVSPESITGRDLYPDEEVHYSTGWLDAHTEQTATAVTGTWFFMFEEKYRHQTYPNEKCYKDICDNKYIFWDDEFQEKWVNQDTGSFHQFTDGESVLTTERNLVYHSGESAIFT
ncbi:hypothetical protein Huta_2140 [Halorhabdus utahensis DSM 12940]|uniref:Uncharacterized protein n=1 Tax=Halorhabdus utahensis (strain DSM 12940 / JCM 11049 / AX-2) TaxID=519442 RepID=C7NU62_HALUD|nr:hypothetical protein [Halorhabdus utahensis]ACV12307.1 hypothetical protein Huta_2140 [Halorhabdus utahensis DSM 12940]